MNKETARLKAELADIRKRKVKLAEKLQQTKARTAITKRKIEILNNMNGFKKV